jgi:hypothetical protein
MKKPNQRSLVPEAGREEFHRLPGLFRRWEIEQVIDSRAEFHLESAGSTSDGTTLFALYRRERSNPNHNPSKEQ